MREKICEMVNVMRRAATVDDECADQEHETVTQLLTENKGLKEMLQIHKRIGVSLLDDSPSDQQMASLGKSSPPSDEDKTPEASDTDDSSDDLNNTVLEIHSINEPESQT